MFVIINFCLNKLYFFLNDWFINLATKNISTLNFKGILLKILRFLIKIANKNRNIFEKVRIFKKFKSKTILI